MSDLIDLVMKLREFFYDNTFHGACTSSLDACMNYSINSRHLKIITRMVKTVPSSGKKRMTELV